MTPEGPGPVNVVPHRRARRAQQFDLGRTFLNARAGTINPGTNQVQRNIIGEMVLGLPKEPKADGGPWKEATRRSDRGRAAQGERRDRGPSVAVANGAAPAVPVGPPRLVEAVAAAADAGSRLCALPDGHPSVGGRRRVTDQRRRRAVPRLVREAHKT